MAQFLRAPPVVPSDLRSPSSLLAQEPCWNPNSAVGVEREVRITFAQRPDPQEGNFDLPAVCFGDFEHFPRLEAHEAGYKDIRKLADSGVVGVHVVIEELAAVRDPLFQLRIDGSATQEILVRL